MINALLVRYARGWHEVTDPAAIAAHGRQEGTLSLGATESVAEVERVAARQLVVNADVREAISVDLKPIDETDLPYAAFGVADRVTVPGRDGTPTVERVTTLTVAEDENGQLSWVPELKDVLLTRAERLEQAIAKMANGSLSGRSPVASPGIILPAPVPIVLPASTAPPSSGTALPGIVLRGQTSVPQYGDTNLTTTDVTLINGGGYFSWVEEAGEWRLKSEEPSGFVLVIAHFNWGTVGGYSAEVWSHLDGANVDGVSYEPWDFGPYDLSNVLPPSQASFGYGSSRVFSVNWYSHWAPYAYQAFAAANRTVTWSLTALLLASLEPPT